MTSPVLAPSMLAAFAPGSGIHERRHAAGYGGSGPPCVGVASPTPTHGGASTRAMSRYEERSIGVPGAPEEWCRPLWPRGGKAEDSRRAPAACRRIAEMPVARTRSCSYSCGSAQTWRWCWPRWQCSARQLRQRSDGLCLSWIPERSRRCEIDRHLGYVDGVCPAHRPCSSGCRAG